MPTISKPFANAVVFVELIVIVELPCESAVLYFTSRQTHEAPHDRGGPPHACVPHNTISDASSAAQQQAIRRRLSQSTRHSWHLGLSASLSPSYRVSSYHAALSITAPRNLVVGLQARFGKPSPSSYSAAVQYRHVEVYRLAQWLQQQKFCSIPRHANIVRLCLPIPGAARMSSYQHTDDIYTTLPPLA